MGHEIADVEDYGDGDGAVRGILDCLVGRGDARGRRVLR